MKAMFTRNPNDPKHFVPTRKLDINSFFFEKGSWGFSAVGADGNLEFFQLCADGQSIRHISTINELGEKLDMRIDPPAPSRYRVEVRAVFG